ncbi:DUF2252_family protein [Hexamita inflata]|uniref:DUF2252_family protein n=1 Tax=Hexamita inflata TaxID=28002 RepID=A0ABP1GYQ3_9EUKA
MDITPLQYLTKLTNLNLNYCGTLQVGSLSTLINLKELYLQGNDIEDITALQYLIELTILDLCACKLSNVDGLKSLVNLKELYLNQNNIDITPLQYLTQLTKLQLQSCGLQSVEALIPLQNLKELDLSHNQIIFAQPLELLQQLKALEMYDNKLIQLPFYFTKFRYIQGYMLDDDKYPTALQIQLANILRNVNAPVTQLNSINRRFRACSRNILGIKNTVNERMKEQTTIMVQFTGKVVQFFYYFSSENYQ